MKKNFVLMLAATAAFALVFSCAKLESPQEEFIPEEGRVDSNVGMTISAILSEAMTKVAFEPEYDGAKPLSLALTWEEGDKLRVYDHANRNNFADYVLTAESVGQKTGAFIGPTFFASSYDVEVFCGELDYAAQTQPSDAVTASLKYWASASDVKDISMVEFTDFSSVLSLTSKLPEGVAANVKSVDLVASEPVFNGGKTLTITLDQTGDAGDDDYLHLFATLPKGSQQIEDGTSLLVRFNAPGTDHTVYTRYLKLGASNFVAGKLNTISINATQADKHAGLTSCDGTTAEKAYLIGDKYQLQTIASLLNTDAATYMELVDDVDLNGFAWSSPKGNISLEGNNHVINNYSGKAGLFLELDGTVKNLNIQNAVISEATARCGLLADYVPENLVVSDVKVTNSSISSTKGKVGSIVGEFTNGVIENVETDCSVEGTQQLGGVVGYLLNGEIRNCVVTGNVTGSVYYEGGIVGLAEGGSIQNSSVSGIVTSNSTGYARVGGLVGQIEGDMNITDCNVCGEVVSQGHYGGGLIGVLAGGVVNVNRCYSTGSVTLPKGANKSGGGGFIGICEIDGTYTIANCYSTGKVTAYRWSAAFIGRATTGKITITNCYSKSICDFTQPDNCGALLGAQNSGAKLTYTGVVVWNLSNLARFIRKDDTTTLSVAEGSYFGTDGTVSAKATEFNWDDTIWDLSKDDPTLK